MKAKRTLLVLLSFGTLPWAAVAFGAAPIQYQGQPVELTVGVSGSHGVRIALAPLDREGRAIALPASPALVAPNQPEPVMKWTSIAGSAEAKAGDYRVTVRANPLAVRVADSTGHVVQELQFDEQTTGGMTFACGDGPVLGMGEGAQQFDRRGALYPMRNGSGAWELQRLGSCIPVPYLIGTKGWALFVVSPWGRFDLRNERGVFLPQAKSPAGVDVIVLDARRPDELMKEFIGLFGRPAMPPKWALGYMQSHRTLESARQMVEIADTFRRKNLPCDAVIYLGTGFCPAGWNTGHGSFAFNPKVFERDPAEVIKDLHARNLRVVLHVVPQGKKSLHGTIPPPSEEMPDGNHIATHWLEHRKVFAMGVDGWWPDEGDWMDIPSRIARHRMYFEGPVSGRPNERPWSLHRNGFAGIARYGGWVWSGDVESRWSTLAAQVSVGQNFSLSVSPFWGTDTGGFVPTKELTGELYARWFQFSAFCPSFRSHGRTWHLRLPWGWNTGEPGPIEARDSPEASELHNEAVEPICRDYLNLRYRLMPYTYTIAREACDTGLPMMRALWLHYPQDPRAVAEGREYLWGRDILVAPVVEKGAAERTVYLPAGDWYDWWTGEKVKGAREIVRKVDLATMPLYVRAGAILPLDPVRQYVAQTVDEPTTLQVYPGADGQFVLYDDDGATLDYLRDQGTWTQLTWSDRERRLRIAPKPGTTSKPKARRVFKVRLVSEGTFKTVEYGGQPAEIAL